MCASHWGPTPRRLSFSNRCSPGQQRREPASSKKAPAQTQPRPRPPRALETTSSRGKGAPPQRARHNCLGEAAPSRLRGPRACRVVGRCGRTKPGMGCGRRSLRNGASSRPAAVEVRAGASQEARGVRPALLMLHPSDPTLHRNQVPQCDEGLAAPGAREPNSRGTRPCDGPTGKAWPNDASTAGRHSPWSDPSAPTPSVAFVAESMPFSLFRKTRHEAQRRRPDPRRLPPPPRREPRPRRGRPPAPVPRWAAERRIAASRAKRRGPCGHKRERGRESRGRSRVVRAPLRGQACGTGLTRSSPRRCRRRPRRRGRGWRSWGGIRANPTRGGGRTVVQVRAS